MVWRDVYVGTSNAWRHSMPVPAPRSILVVEDSPLAQHVTVLALKAAGFRVHSAGTMAEAEAQVRQHPIACCLLDLILPDSVGFKSWSRLHAAAPNVPVIVLTGDPDFAELMRGSAPVLSKPTTTHLLVSTVQAVLAGSSTSPAAS